MHELLQWYNLVFVLPFTAGLGLLLLMAFGGTSGEHDGSLDSHIEAGLHGHDFSHDVDHHVGGHGHDHDHGHDHGHHENFAMKFMSFIGYGKVPLSLLFMCMCFIWGFTGWAAITFFQWILRYPLLFFWPALVTAAVCTIFLTRYLALGLAKAMPSTETYAPKAREMVGLTGKVRYPVTEISGTVCLYDKHRNFQEIQCRVQEGAPLIEANTSVLVVDYVADRSVYLVRIHDLS